MFPGRPVPQQQNPWEMAPEVYVERGRNLGKEEGYQAGWNDGWNAAVAQANQIIGQQEQMAQALQQQVQSGVEKYNQQVVLGRVYFQMIETLCRDNPSARKAIMLAFKKHYLRETRDTLKRGNLRCEPHQSAEFLNGAPLTSRFIQEALMT